MDVSADIVSRNLPEMLARDLAESQDIFLARSRTAGPPAVALAFGIQAPHVPQRKPTCAATSPGLHRTTSDSDLCSLGKDSATSFGGGYEEDQEAHKTTAAPFGTYRTLRRMNRAGVKNFHLKMEHDKDERRVFLNGFDDEWGSDSSADMDAGMSASSVRLRQQSITTAATSVEAQSVAGGKGPGGEKSIPEGPTYHLAPGSKNDCESWVDFDEPRMSDSEVGHDRGVPVRSWEMGHMASHCYPTPAEPTQQQQQQNFEFEQKSHSVPQRRSSLSHQITTVVLSEATPALQPTPHKPAPSGLSSRLLELLPAENNNSNNPHYPFSTVRPYSDDWKASEPALSPIVRFDRRQPSQTRQFHRTLNTTRPFDRLPPSPAPSAPEQQQQQQKQFREPLHSSTNQPQQLPPPQPQLPSPVSPPRNSHSTSRMPFLTQVNSWLGEASGNAGQRRCPPAHHYYSPTSPIGVAPVANIRVSTEILENLRIMVQGFPDTMLSTNCLTVQTIQSYSRKLRIGDIKHERLSPRGSDELFLSAAAAAAKSPTSLDLSPSQHHQQQALERKASLGNLKLMTSLRGKISSRFAGVVSSPTSSFNSSRENSEEPWPPVDNNNNHHPSVRCNSSPSRPSAIGGGDGGHHYRRSNQQQQQQQQQYEKEHKYVTALRSIFPTGTDYLLDALYAHIIVYNYINSLCGGFPHLHQNGPGGSHPPSSSLSSAHFAVPAGVTSLADLQLLQEDIFFPGNGDDDHDDHDAFESDGISFSRSRPHYHNITNINNRNHHQGAVVPSKAAAMLGLGSTNMGQPIRPAPGTLGGRAAKLRKTTPPGASFSTSLESEATLRNLRDQISRNIYRLADTVKSSSSSPSSSGATSKEYNNGADEDGDDEDSACVMGPHGKELEPTLLRAMCEVVRCYEELTA